MRILFLPTYFPSCRERRASPLQLDVIQPSLRPPMSYPFTDAKMGFRLPIRLLALVRI